MQAGPLDQVQNLVLGEQPSENVYEASVGDVLEGVLGIFRNPDPKTLLSRQPVGRGEGFFPSSAWSEAKAPVAELRVEEGLNGLDDRPFGRPVLLILDADRARAVAVALRDQDDPLWPGFILAGCQAFRQGAGKTPPAAVI